MHTIRLQDMIRINVMEIRRSPKYLQYLEQIQKVLCIFPVWEATFVGQISGFNYDFLLLLGPHIPEGMCMEVGKMFHTNILNAMHIILYIQLFEPVFYAFKDGTLHKDIYNIIYPNHLFLFQSYCLNIFMFNTQVKFWSAS